MKGRKSRRSRPEEIKCQSCFKIVPVSKRILPWTPFTHWMYFRELKQCAIYLLMVRRSKDNIFSRLDKNVWYIIMRHIFTISEHEVAPHYHKRFNFCDPCMRKIYQMPICLYCHDNTTLSASTEPDIKYKLVKNEFVEIPALCERCGTRQYICELHKSKPPRTLCFKCKNPSNILDGFKSYHWTHLRPKEVIRKLLNPISDKSNG